MIQHKSFTFRSICFFCLYAVSTLVWNPNVGRGTLHLVIVELLYYLCVVLDTALSFV
jgi:lipopolysaccharide export LptBFGC system permease protein LptF